MDKKMCDSCKHYKHYYFKLTTGYQIRFEKANTGVCQLIFKNGRRRQTDEICNEYKEKILQEENSSQQTTIKKLLLSIEKHLHQLTEVLEAE